MPEQTRLSPWWKSGLIPTLVIGFTILIWLASRSYRDAPPIPDRVLSPTGETLITRSDILAGQQVFLKYGLMGNGTIWGHGAYLGPDFSAEYLHTLAEDVADPIGKRQYRRALAELTSAQRVEVDAEVQGLLKENRYEPQARTLVFTDAETESYRRQGNHWARYLSDSKQSACLPTHYISDSEEQR